MGNKRLIDLTTKGLLIALVTISTMILQIPIPATEGYIHLGDGVIFLISVFFGGMTGMLAGGIGSALADIFSGYAHYAVFTLIIKGLMGYAVGIIANYTGGQTKFLSARVIMAALIGACIMIIGYFIAGTILLGDYRVALGEVPWNCVQGFGGCLIFVILGLAFDKGKLYRYFPKNEPRV